MRADDCDPLGPARGVLVSVLAGPLLLLIAAFMVWLAAGPVAPKAAQWEPSAPAEMGR